MTHSHTPGPWRYEAGTKTIRSVPANYWLASMDSFDGAVDHTANAHLIAEAPELLQVCKRVLRDSERGVLTIDTVQLITDAIAKAEGHRE